MTEKDSITMIQQTLLRDGRIGFDNIIDPIHEIFKVSEKICELTVLDLKITKKLIMKLQEEKIALIRVKIVKLICQIWRKVKSSMKRGDILLLQRIISGDASILVREIGKKLILTDTWPRKSNEFSSVKKDDASMELVRSDLAHFVLSEND